MIDRTMGVIQQHNLLKNLRMGKIFTFEIVISTKKDFFEFGAEYRKTVVLIIFISKQKIIFNTDLGHNCFQCCFS